MPSSRHRSPAFRSIPLRRSLLVALGGWLSGCATGNSGDRSAGAIPASAAAPGLPDGAALASEAAQVDYLLLGEVHDNGAQHRLRLQWLEHLTRERRVALAMEQFDSERQADLDRARASAIDRARADSLGRARVDPPIAPGQDSPAAPEREAVRRIAEGAGFEFAGWQWEFYAPYLELAVRRDLPLIAANLSRRETMRIARSPAAAMPTPQRWGELERRAMTEAIRDGHCGLLPETMIEPMVAAQQARDRHMAQMLIAARARTGLPIVLLAGNGHVRRDIGVPYHLRELQPAARLLAVGLIERGERVNGPFDRITVTEAAERPDPCVALRERFGKRGAAPASIDRN